MASTSRSYHAGMSGTAAVQQPAAAAAAACLDVSVEYLLLELIRYYSLEQDTVAAVHAVETIGFRIGSQLAERLTVGQERIDEPLIKFKFLCTQLWTALFGRKVDGLKTNHKGRFVLDDKAVKWLLPLGGSASNRDTHTGAQRPEARARASARKAICDLYVALACSCIKGALSHLNMACSVVGNCDAAPACAPLHKLACRAH